MDPASESDDKPKADEGAGQEAHRDDQSKEVVIVPLTNAVVEPLAVVVEVSDTAVTAPTVLAAFFDS
jgi:RES domain-containing protein